MFRWWRRFRTREEREDLEDQWRVEHGILRMRGEQVFDAYKNLVGTPWCSGTEALDLCYAEYREAIEDYNESRAMCDRLMNHMKGIDAYVDGREEA